MRLEAVSIVNFRCYGEGVNVELDDLTTFIGRNDIGKSTILEALEIFFNGDLVSMEQGLTFPLFFTARSSVFREAQQPLAA